MTRALLLALVAFWVTATVAPAQDVGASIKDARQSYNSIKDYLTRAAKAMPEENYSFKPTPDIRTFAALLAHIADHQVRFCSTAMGAAKQTDYLAKTNKADLQAALAASFELCDSAWNSITDANANEMVGQRSKFGTLLVDVIHSNEEYGYMALYFRLKGLVPPSTDRNVGK